MSVRVIYKCNLCHEDKHKDYVWGLRFSDMHTFKLDKPESTEGTHICELCLRQLKEQLAQQHTAEGGK